MSSSSPGSKARRRSPKRRPARCSGPSCCRNPVEDRDLERLDPADYAAEWKWDGIRVQAVSEAGIRRLYSRTGDDVSGAFPDLVDAMDFSRRARRRTSGRRPGGGDRHVLRPATAIEPQVGLAQGARSVSGLHALLRPLAARRRGPQASALHGAAPASRILRRDARSHPLRPVAAGALRPLGCSRRDAQEPSASGDRGRHAEASAIRPISRAVRRVLGSSGSATRTRSMRC